MFNKILLTPPPNKSNKFPIFKKYNIFLKVPAGNGNYDDSPFDTEKDFRIEINNNIYTAQDATIVYGDYKFKYVINGDDNGFTITRFFFDYSFFKFNSLTYNEESFNLPFGSQTVKIPTMDVYIKINFKMVIT